MGRPSKNASRMRKNRGNETEEARSARLAKCRTYSAARLHNETEDVRQQRLSKMREYSNRRRQRLHHLETRKHLESLEPPIAVFIKQEFEEATENSCAESSDSTLASSNELLSASSNELLSASSNELISANDPDPFCNSSEVMAKREEDPENISSSELIIPEKEDSEFYSMQPVKEEEEIKPPVAIFIKQEVTEEEGPWALTAASDDAAALENASGVLSEDDPDYCVSADPVKAEKQTDRLSDTGSSEYIIPEHLTLSFSNKCFSSENDVRCEDTTEKPYECTICKMRFSLKLLCDIHQQIHAGQKPHECHICKSTFTQKSNLLCHLRIHEKPYECAICKKCFSTRLACDKHMQTHTGVKPYECSICRKCFSQKWNLLRHIPSHNDEKTYVCNFCKKNFFIHSQLMGHIKTHLLMNLNADLEKQKQTREKT